MPTYKPLPVWRRWKLKESVAKIPNRAQSRKTSNFFLFLNLHHPKQFHRKLIPRQPNKERQSHGSCINICISMNILHNLLRNIIILLEFKVVFYMHTVHTLAHCSLPKMSKYRAEAVTVKDRKSWPQNNIYFGGWQDCQLYTYHFKLHTAHCPIIIVHSAILVFIKKVIII